MAAADSTSVERQTLCCIKYVSQLFLLPFFSSSTPSSSRQALLVLVTNTTVIIIIATVWLSNTDPRRFTNAIATAIALVKVNAAASLALLIRSE